MGSIQPDLRSAGRFASCSVIGLIAFGTFVALSSPGVASVAHADDSVRLGIEFGVAGAWWRRETHSTPQDSPADEERTTLVRCRAPAFTTRLYALANVSRRAWLGAEMVRLRSLRTDCDVRYYDGPGRVDRGNVQLWLLGPALELDVLRAPRLFFRFGTGFATVRTAGEYEEESDARFGFGVNFGVGVRLGNWTRTRLNVIGGLSAIYTFETEANERTRSRYLKRVVWPSLRVGFSFQ